MILGMVCGLGMVLLSASLLQEVILIFSSPVMFGKSHVYKVRVYRESLSSLITQRELGVSSFVKYLRDLFLTFRQSEEQTWRTSP